MTNDDLSVRGSKILFLSYYYPPAALPGAHRAAKFIRNLEDGQIFVLTVKPELYPSHVDLNFGKDIPINNEQIIKTSVFDLFKLLLGMRRFFSNLIKRNGSVPIEYSVNPAIFAPPQSPPSNPKSLFSKFKDLIYLLLYFPDEASTWIFPAFNKGIKLIKQEKIDVIFASGSPWSSLILGMLMQKTTKVPFIADFRDPWTGNPYITSKGAFLDRMERYLERKVVTNATLVIANTEPLRKQFIERYPVIPKDKFVVLPNGFDLADFASVNSDFSQSTPQRGTLVLAHAGFLYSRRDPTPLIDALILSQSRTNDLEGKISFLQMGNVHLDYDFDVRYANLIQSKAIVKVGQLPHADCLQRLKNADVLVIIQPATETQIPSKLYDYLCLNRPILTITPLQGALGDMISRYGFGYVYDPSDIEGIAAKLEELYQEKTSTGFLNANYRKRDSFNVLNVTAELAGHIRQITHRAP